MKAGRELDALVAEKVMGWKLSKYEHFDAWTDGKGNWAIKQMWHPSSDIRDAWRVVEKMEDLGFELHLDSSLDEFWKKLYFCEFSNRDNTIIVGSDEETAPLAICLSSLKCFGIDVGGDQRCQGGDDAKQ